MISFDEAAALLEAVAVPVGTEQVSLAAAAGRVLAEHVQARIDSPRANVSAMDGYAVRTAEVRSGAILPIVGRSYPGQPFEGELPVNACVRVFTGGALPVGADRVIMQEVVTEAEDRAHFRDPAAGPSFVRPQGSDFRTGDLLLPAGQRLTPGALMAAGGGDVDRLTVRRQPRVGLLATGDELVAPGLAAAHAAAVPDSVSAALAALTLQWGGANDGCERAGDDPDAGLRSARRLLGANDVLVITGGASVGERDGAKTIFAALGGELLFSKVAIKPGKPVWAGRAAGKLVLGLPGNPTSALVTARLLLAPCLCALGGGTFAEGLRFRLLALAADLPGEDNRERFLRGHDEGDRVSLAKHQDSNGQRTPGSTNLLVRIAANAPALRSGAPVRVLDL